MSDAYADLGGGLTDPNTPIEHLPGCDLTGYAGEDHAGRPIPCMACKGGHLQVVRTPDGRRAVKLRRGVPAPRRGRIRVA